MPPLQLNPSLCLPLIYPRSSCRLCVEGCPVNALEIREDSISSLRIPCFGFVSPAILLTLISTDAERIIFRDAHICELCELFHTVNIGRGCNGCKLCTLFCPTGALFKIEKEDVEGIGFRLSHCSPCGLCSEVCLKKAVTYGDRIDIIEIIEDRERPLILFKKGSCKVCEATFIKVDEGEICDRCKKESLLFG